MTPWHTSGIRGSEVYVLLTQAMPSGRRDYAIAKAVQIDGVPFCRAVGRDFEEEE
jgi:hypothetical protein